MIIRQKTYQCCSKTDNGDGPTQCFDTTLFIAPVTKEYATQRSADKTCRKNSKSSHCRMHCRVCRKKLCADDRCEINEYPEIKPLYNIAKTNSGDITNTHHGTLLRIQAL